MYNAVSTHTEDIWDIDVDVSNFTERNVAESSPVSLCHQSPLIVLTGMSTPWAQTPDNVLISQTPYNVFIHFAEVGGSLNWQCNVSVSDDCTQRIQPQESSLENPASRVHPRESSLENPALRIQPWESSLENPASRVQPWESIPSFHLWYRLMLLFTHHPMQKKTNFLTEQVSSVICTSQTDPVEHLEAGCQHHIQAIKVRS